MVKRAERATDALNDATRQTTTATGRLNSETQRLTSEYGRLQTAARGLGSTIGSVIGSMVGLVGGFTALGAAQYVIDAIRQAFDHARASAEAVTEANRQFNASMVKTSEALAGVTIQTYRLADARKQAALEASAANRAENTERIRQVGDRSIQARLGRLIMGSYGRNLDAAEQAAMNQLREQNNRLLKDEIQLVLTENKAKTEADRIIAAALPKEAALLKIAQDRAVLERQLRYGQGDAAQIRRALNALDQQALDLSKEDTKATTANTRAVKERSSALKVTAVHLQTVEGAVGQAHVIAQKLFADGKLLTQPWEDAAEAVREYAEQAERDLYDLARAAEDVSFAVDDIWRAIKRGDGLAAGGGVVNLFRSISGAFTSGGVMGGTAALASTGAGLIGGTGGRLLGAASAGLGLASMGTSIGALGSAFSVGGSMASVGTLGLGSSLTALSTAMPYIGAAVAAVMGVVALAKAFQKPSNQGAGYDLITGAFSGKSRTEETENAVRQTGDAILAMQRGLESSGITLGDTIRGLVIGSRDPSQLYTASGKTLTSAVGDPTAATETALKAMLEGATYVSETQKKLVTSMMEAGKGFDAIAEALASYERAQSALKGIDDAILSLRDPKAYELKVLNDAQEARRKGFQADLDAGLISAEQFAALLPKLKELEGLELAEALKRYADAANDNAASLEQIQKDAEATALQAYNRESAALNATINEYGRVRDSLRAFREGLDLSQYSALNDNQRYGVARAAFDALGGLDSLDRVQATSEAFLTASKATAVDSRAYARDMAAVRTKVTAAERLAGEQVDVATAQLNAMTAIAAELGLINTNLISFAQAVTAARAVGVGTPTAANQNGAPTTADYAAYVQAYPDLMAAYNSYGAARGQSLADFGLQHWNAGGDNGGMAEGRHIPGFWSGGSFDVAGPTWGDQVPVTFNANGGEHVNISREDSMARVADALERQNALLDEQNNLLRSIDKSNDKIESNVATVTQNGYAMLTEEAA